MTGRERIVVFDGAYHGGPLYFGSGGAALRVPFDTIVLPYNDTAAATTAIESSDDIAGVLVEPMMGAAGCIPGDKAFLQILRDVTAATGTMLIFDEVMTSRLAFGGAHGLLGITPDLVTLGKYLAGGFSFGAFGGSVAVMAHFDPAAGGTLTHGGTFNNNAFTMAAGTEIGRQLDAAALDELNHRGDRLRTRLNATFEGKDPPFVAIGRGSFVGIHPVAGPVRSPADLAAADQRRRHLLFHELLDAGYYIAPRGYLALSMAITDEHLDGFVDAVAAAL